MIFYGAGGHAKVVIEAWLAYGGKVTTIYDDNTKVRSILGKSVAGLYDANAFPDTRIIISVGSNSIRRDVVARVRNLFGNVIHPNTVVSPSATIGEGTVVMAGSIVQASTVVGKHVIINTSASVDHDCAIGDYVHVAPGSILCGEVKVGEGTLIGAGATVLPGVSIGRWAVIGAGSVVTSDVPDYAVAVGVPSKIIRDASPSTSTTTSPS